MRRRGAKGHRGSGYDWGRVEQAFVADGLSYAECAEKFGVSVDLVRKRSEELDWSGKRESFRKKVLDQIQSVAESDARRNARQSLVITNGLKLRLANRLASRLNDPNYVPTVNDFVMLQRLEADLMHPERYGVLLGKAGDEAQATGFAEVLRASLEARRKALANLGVVSDEAAESDAIAFLYGGAAVEEST